MAQTVVKTIKEFGNSFKGQLSYSVEYKQLREDSISSSYLGGLNTDYCLASKMSIFSLRNHPKNPIINLKGGKVNMTLWYVHKHADALPLWPSSEHNNDLMIKTCCSFTGAWFISTQQTKRLNWLCCFLFHS